ncbi:hypothetical protein GXW82_21330 [Streptacidiphilus sp. 4-A2]|nr:hypothetical protein [Streptacidiphilus sp. 4-A2]
MSWTVLTSPQDDRNGYLANTQTSYTVTSVHQQLTLQLASPVIDAHNNLTFYQYTHSSNGTVPSRHVYLQQSSDGRTGWATVATLPASSNNDGDWSTITHAVSNPHGYWRLYAPASLGFPVPAYSNTIHTFRYQTRITGGPSTTHAHKNQSVAFTGHLQQQGYGTWTACANNTVEVLYRPSGSTHAYVMGTARTNGLGAFSTDIKIPGNGTWYLSYQTTSPWSTDSTTTGTLIHLS